MARRAGEKQAKDIRGIENPIARTLATGAYGVSAGLDQFARGFERGVFGDLAGNTTSAVQYGSAYIREDLKDAGPKIFGSSLGQLAYDATTATGNMAPSILLSALTAGAGAPAIAAQGVGAVSMGASAGGNAYNQALREGYSKEEARNYAVLIGASEAGLQYLLGGIGALGGKLTGKAAQTTVQNIDNALLRIGADLGVNMLGEGTEEYLQEILEPAFRNLCFDEHNEIKLVSEEAAYSFLLGAITAGLLEGGRTVSSNMDLNKAGAAVRVSGQLDALVERSLALDPKSEAASMAAQMRTGALHANDINVGQLLTAYAEAGGSLDFMLTPQQGTAGNAPVSPQETEGTRSDAQAVNSTPAEQGPTKGAEEADTGASTDPLVQAMFGQKETASTDEQSGETVKAPVSEIGVKYSGDILPDREYRGQVLDAVRGNLPQIQKMQSVAALSGEEFQKTTGDTRSLRAKVIDFFNSLGNKVTRPGMGEITLNAAGARDSTAHGYGRLKAATFAALPAVLEKGALVKTRGPYEGHNYNSYLIAAPVTVNGTPCYVGALVIQDANTQRYKLHEVLMTNESGVPLFKSETTSQGADGPLRNDTPLETSEDVSTDTTIQQPESGVKPQFTQERDAPIQAMLRQGEITQDGQKTGGPEQDQNMALAYDIQRMRQIGATLGENGARTLAAIYDETLAAQYAPEQVAESFIQIYNATLNGRRLSEAAARKAAELPDYIRLAAEDSAQRDLVRAGQTASHGPEERPTSPPPEQDGGEKGLYRSERTDMPRFPALEEYDGEIKIVEQFSPTQYVIKLEPPVISGTTKHFLKNLATRQDRIGLTVEAAQDIINKSKIVLYQTEWQTLKFISDNGYALINLNKKLITAVPEKLRNKYKKYLEGK